jgi:hypothetical protein
MLAKALGLSKEQFNNMPDKKFENSQLFQMQREIDNINRMANQLGDVDGLAATQKMIKQPIEKVIGSGLTHKRNVYYYL